MESMRYARQGFTLVELLVVLAIVGLLAGLMIVGVQAARESARRMECGENLRQMAIAVSLYENMIGSYPPSFKMPAKADLAAGPVDGWSAQVLILPFLEEEITQSRIDLTATFDENFAPVVSVTDGPKPISAVRVPVYLCPSEPRDEIRFENGAPRHYPLNYGFNLGEWLVFDPATGEGGNGAFSPENRLSAQNIRDGLTKTMMLAEVRSWQPYYRNAALAEDLKMPGSPAQLCDWAGAEFKTESGHTEWVDGRAHQTGFTTLFTPNTRVACIQDNTRFDIDWTNQQEGKSPTVKTYAAVTARSYHPGLVNVAMMDGTLRPVADNVDLAVWRAMSTREGADQLK